MRARGLQPEARANYARGLQPEARARGLQPEARANYFGMEVASILCVRSSARAAWIPVPISRRGGLACVTVTSSKSPWAIRALTGAKKDRDSCGATLVLKAFESDVRAQTCSQVAGREGTDAAPPPSKKPRLLGSDSEDEEESEQEEDDSQQSSCTKVPRGPTRRVDKVGFTKIELDGVEVEVGFHKGPGVQVPANAETVAKVLTFLETKYDILLAAGRDLAGQRLAARRDGPHELLAKVRPSQCRKDTSTPGATLGRDTNKIRFDFTRDAFKLLYFDGDTQKRTTKGFEVPRVNAFGLVLGHDDYAKMKAGVLHKARMAWNKLDKSDEPRFQDQSSSDVAKACSHERGDGLQP